MDKSNFLLFICFGGTLLQYAKCFSDGNFDGILDICQTMKVSHNDFSAQTSEPPFIIQPSSVSVNDTNRGTSIPVSLIADRPFMGFMLEARKRDSNEPQGQFTLVQTDISRLQTCTNVDGNAVTQTDNTEKRQVSVNWSTIELGQYFFRVTFIETFEVFWEIDIPPTPASPSTAASTTPATRRTSSSSQSSSSSSSSQSQPTSAYAFANTTSTFTSTSANSTNSNSNITTSTQSTPTHTHGVYVQTNAERKGFLTLQFLSCLSLAETFPFLINHRMHQSIISIKALSFLSLVLSLVAFIIIVIYQVVLCSILTGLGAVLGVSQLILLFCFRGPSHELRRIFCRMFGLIAFANACFISASIFTRLLESERPCSWLPIVTGIYLASMLLLCVLHGVLHTKCQTTSKTVLKKQVSCWSVNCVFYTVINILFIIALILGTFLCMQ